MSTEDVSMVKGASIGGRPITLDPIRTITVPLEVREVESTIPAGFQQVWGEGEVGDRKIEATAGAGWGSTWGTIRFDGKGYVFSIRQLLEAFVEQIDSTEGS